MTTAVDPPPEKGGNDDESVDFLGFLVFLVDVFLAVADVLLLLLVVVEAATPSGNSFPLDPDNLGFVVLDLLALVVLAASDAPAGVAGSTVAGLAPRLSFNFNLGCVGLALETVLSLDFIKVDVLSFKVTLGLT